MTKSIKLTWEQAGVIDALLEYRIYELSNRLGELIRGDDTLIEDQITKAKSLEERFDELCWSFRLDELEKEIRPNEEEINEFGRMTLREFKDEFWDLDMLGCWLKNAGLFDHWGRIAALLVLRDIGRDACRIFVEEYDVEC